MIKHHNCKEIINNININKAYDMIPKRQEFLNETDVKHIKTLKKDKKKLLFLGNSIKESVPFHNYKLIIAGILPDGSKTVVEIVDIYPYVDIEYDTSLTEKQNKSAISTLTSNNNIHYYKIKIVKGKDLILYNETPKQYLRIYFKNIMARKKCIKLILENNIKSYNNDTSSYYRVVAREYHLNLCSWNEIKNYRDIKIENEYKSEYQLSISINDIKPIDIDAEKETLMKDKNIKYNDLKKDKLISMCFDIEMYSSELGRMPSGKNPEDIIFMICMTFQFINDDKSFLNVCLVSKECDVQPELYTIECGSEKNVLKMFAIFVTNMQPDFITEFNGSDFDWKVIIQKCQYYNLIPFYAEHFSLNVLTNYNLKVDQILEWNTPTIRVKLSAEMDAYSYNLQQFGYIPFDTRIIFRKLYPKDSKSSLNYYLQIHDLTLKDDMEIKRMFEIYESGTSAEMKLVAHYCLVDSFQLHELLKKKHVIQDKREVCLVSYTSLFDGFYRADGVKVKNLIISRCLMKNIFYNSVMNNSLEYNKEAEDDNDEEKAKYPGAMVLEPIKGLVSSLYNIKEFNDKLDTSEQCDIVEINKLYEYIDKNYEDIFINKTIDITTVDNNLCKKYIDYIKTNEMQYPVSGLDFSSLYPSIIMAYNLSPEYLVLDKNYANYLRNKGVILHHINFKLLNRNEEQIEGWTVRHNDNPEQFGLYPSILKELFDKRVIMKKQLKIYKDKIEHTEAMDQTKSYITDEDYIDNLFNMNYYNSKQLALKVFMNTFYGETGNSKSPLFMIQLAGGTTSAGQYNLLLIKDYIEKLNTKIYYGDSVTGETPVIIKRNNQIEIIPIEELNWKNNEIIQSDKKEIIIDNETEVYTEDGWTKIKKCIRHYTNKDLYRITTHTGSVIVTEDHSLLDNNKQKIKPEECKIGTELLHWKNLNNNTKNIDKINILSDLNIIKEIKENISFVYGFFYGDGSCGRYECSSGIKYSFALNNQNIDILNKCINIFNLYHTDVKLKLIDTIESSGVYKAIAVGKVSKLVNIWRTYFYSDRKYKKVPTFILNSDNETKLLFLQGYYLADGDKNGNRMCNKGQIGSQGLYLLLHNLGYNVSINTRKDKLDIYRLTFTTNKQRINPNIIKKIEYIGKSKDYVYDLETESHHFSAGVGKLVVHNTDSLYISCDKKTYIENDKMYYTNKITKEEYSTKMVDITFDEIDKLKQLVNKRLIDDNGTKFLKMSYEEVLFPAAFFTKKNYYGIPHEGLVNFKPKKLFIRGLKLIKRDSSQLLVKSCSDVLWKAMALSNTKTITDLVIENIEDIFTIEWVIDDFIKKAKWNPDKNNVKLNTFIQRLKDRNMVLPEPFQSFGYIMVKKYPYTYDIKGRQTKIKAGDQMEFVETVKQENLEINLLYYFEKEILGQLARFIAYNKEYEIYDNGILNDDATYENCKKVIMSFADKYNKSYKNIGKIYKDLYRTISKQIKPVKSSKLNYILSINNTQVNEYNDILINLERYANCCIDSKYINKIIKSYKKHYKTDGKQNNDFLYKLHNIYSEKRKSYYNLTSKNIKTKLEKNKKDLYNLLQKYNLLDKLVHYNDINIGNIIDYIKETYDFNKKCGSYDSTIDTLGKVINNDDLTDIINNEEFYINIDTDVINEIYNLIIDIISNYKKLYINKKLKDEIFILLNKSKNIIEKPKNFKI